MTFIKWTLVAVPAFLMSFSLVDHRCVQTRAAFDVGSGSTKMKVAKVNTCLQKIETLLLESDVAVAYKEDLNASPDKVLSAKVMSQGLSSLADLMERAEAFRPEEYRAVATAAFREAKNTASFLERVEAELGLKVQVLTQNAEAQLGFVAASTLADQPLNKVVVWDIGGASMQMISYEQRGQFSIYEGDLASVSFKNHIITDLQKQNLKSFHSPNPMGPRVAEAAVQFARQKAQSDVPKSIQNKLKSGAQVLGIGGVHFFSVKNQIDKNLGSYHLPMVRSALERRWGLTDDQIGGDYAATDVSNLALVLGFMEALHIQNVKVGRINLTDGLLLQ